MYSTEGEEQETTKVPWTVGFVIALTLVGTFLFGIIPSIVLKGLEKWITI
jgi:hypothetical protein